MVLSCTNGVDSWTTTKVANWLDQLGLGGMAPRVMLALAAPMLVALAFALVQGLE